MASAELQSALDQVFAPHLRLEPRPDELPKYVRSNVSCQVTKSKNFLQGTLEADNKKRPGIHLQNSLRYKISPPEPPDPNSEPKSVVINNVQKRLEKWNEELKKIEDKKERNDEVLSREIKQRDEKIEDLSAKYAKECSIRAKTEKERNSLSEKLRTTTISLNEYKSQNAKLQTELSQCQIAYQQTEARRLELEEETVELYDKVVQIEEMKKRLNDQVTELQGQVSMLQRSSGCTIQ